MTNKLTFSFRKRKFNLAPYRDSWHEFEAFEGERLVGRVVCFEAPRRSGDCWIHDLWVSHWHRQSGVGSELLTIAIEAARDRGYLRMLGELRPYDGETRKGAEDFFKYRGFQIEENWDQSGKTVVLLMLT